jgi:hypothetical protein
MKVIYDDQTPVVGAKIYVRDSSGSRTEGLYGVTNDQGEILILAPPPWYTRGTYDIVVDAGNTRIGTFWGYFLGFMTPVNVTINVTRTQEPPIVGPIDYPTYHPAEQNGWTLTLIVVAVVAVGVYVAYRFIEMWRRTGHEYES